MPLPIFFTCNTSRRSITSMAFFYFSDTFSTETGPRTISVHGRHQIGNNALPSHGRSSRVGSGTSAITPVTTEHAGCPSQRRRQCLRYKTQGLSKNVRKTLGTTALCTFAGRFRVNVTNRTITRHQKTIFPQHD